LEFPQRLSVETTTRCNLSCKFCPKQSQNYKLPEMDMDFETFKKLKQVLPHIKSIVLNGISEPLLHPQLEEFLAFSKENTKRDASIGFQTNGVFLSEKRMEQLVKAGLNRICVSIDCVVPINGFHIPEFSKRALEVVYKAKKDGAKIESGVEIVITKENLDQVIPTIIESSKYEIDFVILSHLIPYSPEATKNVVYETNNKEAVQIFKKWYSKLVKKGYTVDDWIDQIKKKALPEYYPVGNEALQLYISMYDEANKKGKTINLKNTLSRDENLLAQVEKILKDIRELKKKLNIDIKILRINPKPKRTCEFIEKKEMYIGVDGEVSPCYFLWHSYTVYIAGFKKNIKRWSFGNIKEKDPVEIYNLPEYRRFRESVIEYDFPYCYDCNFALCDLMELENFIGDCYTNSIPCGSCLWCGGLFNCML